MNTDWKVGDTVIVTGNYVRNGARTISKVGRKYFYIEGDGRNIPYDIGDGWAKNDGYGRSSRVRTPEQYDADCVRAEVMQKLQDHGVRWTDDLLGKRTFHENNFSTARLFELLHFLDNVAADKAEFIHGYTNLDRN